MSYALRTRPPNPRGFMIMASAVMLGGILSRLFPLA